MNIDNRRTGLARAFVAMVLIFANGCAATTVAGRAPKKDMSVLNPGTGRSQVVSELGTPILSRDKEGEKIDTFSFDPGISGGAKFGRATFHVVADLFTIFLWELIGWPSEKAAASGKHTKLDVTYDKDENVKYATYLK